MRKPFQSFPAKPTAPQAAKPSLSAPDVLLDEALAAMRARIEARFDDAGLELTDADLVAVSTGVAEAIRAMETSAVETLISFKKASAK